MNATYPHPRIDEEGAHALSFTVEVFVVVLGEAFAGPPNRSGPILHQIFVLTAHLVLRGEPEWKRNRYFNLLADGAEVYVAEEMDPTPDDLFFSLVDGTAEVVGLAVQKK
ncbi:MAG: hypothetical protein HY716_01800 [Planctomycetes bacterium]|nr:hypothetical protein [Planctomycetota bacterium]